MRHRSALVDVGYLSLSLRDLLHGRLGAPRDDRRPGVVESAPGEQWARRDHKGENWRAVQEWACCAAPHSFQDRSLARRRPRHRVRRFPASGVTSRIDRSRSRDRMPPCNRLVMLCTSCIARDAPAALQTLHSPPLKSSRPLHTSSTAFLSPWSLKFASLQCIVYSTALLSLHSSSQRAKALSRPNPSCFRFF